MLVCNTGFPDSNGRSQGIEKSDETDFLWKYLRMICLALLSVAFLGGGSIAAGLLLPHFAGALVFAFFNFF